ncbi:MAG: hypothetical protein CVT88_10495 [Candidatus Altiarchaeales archaeon HGW-Altiarchaeales-1]|nr:MAG: hypothetical protein CVT88_10495 [Candidatus Altiarchaeales archaeon HGW-Altiarchaeales-1]
MEKLKFADAKNIVVENLKALFNVEEFEITYVEEKEDVWKINAEFKEITSTGKRYTSALFGIDAITGEVKEFRKDYMGRF